MRRRSTCTILFRLRFRVPHFSHTLEEVGIFAKSMAMAFVRESKFARLLLGCCRSGNDLRIRLRCMAGRIVCCCVTRLG